MSSGCVVVHVDGTSEVQRRRLSIAAVDVRPESAMRRFHYAEKLATGRRHRPGFSPHKTCPAGAERFQSQYLRIEIVGFDIDMYATYLLYTLQQYFRFVFGRLQLGILAALIMDMSDEGLVERRTPERRCFAEVIGATVDNECVEYSVARHYQFAIVFLQRIVTPPIVKTMECDNTPP
jgi:hypothetical protein